MKTNRPTSLTADVEELRAAVLASGKRRIDIADAAGIPFGTLGCILAGYPAKPVQLEKLRAYLAACPPAAPVAAPPKPAVQEPPPRKVRPVSAPAAVAVVQPAPVAPPAIPEPIPFPPRASVKMASPVPRPTPTPASTMFRSVMLEAAESLDEDSKTTLVRHLADAQNSLLEARSALTMAVRRDSKRDRHITAALNEIGFLRLAANEGDL